VSFLLKVIFFGLLSYLILDGLNSDKKMKRAIGEDKNFDFTKGVGLLGQSFTKYFNRKEVDIRLKRAGNPYGITVDSFVGLKIITPVLMAASQLNLGSRSSYYLLIISALMFFLPDVWIKFVERDRQKAIKKELPDIIDIFESSAASGLDVGTAFSLAAGYVNGKELMKELSLMAAKYTVTRDKEEALTGFKDNINMYETDLLVLALLQDHRTGKAQYMLESLANEQANKEVASLEIKGKAVEYKVLMASSLMAVSAALTIFYPYLTLLQDGLQKIFK